MIQSDANRCEHMRSDVIVWYQIRGKYIKSDKIRLKNVRSDEIILH